MKPPACLTGAMIWRSGASQLLRFIAKYVRRAAAALMTNRLDVRKNCERGMGMSDHRHIPLYPTRLAISVEYPYS
jgi:hypothetical protein